MTGGAETRTGGIVELASDRESLAGELAARAFQDDDLFAWVEPDAERRAAFLVPFMTALVRRSRHLAVALATAPALEGISLWKGPDLRQLSPEQLARTGLDRIPEWLDAAALARFDAIFDPIEAALAADVPEPCWYLGVLAVEPGRQGQGLGSRLMAPILARADREGLAVTLETAKARNLPLYRRHGFEVLRELAPPEPGGPAVWTMRRPPAAGPTAR
jgi:GNAT superfamily N-acetyltransferase